MQLSPLLLGSKPVFTHECLSKIGLVTLKYFCVTRPISYKIRQNHATSLPTYSTSSTIPGVLHLNNPNCKCKCNMLVVQYNVKWKLKICKVWQGRAGSRWLIEWSFILYLVLDTSLDLYSCVHGIEGKCRYLENLFDTSPQLICNECNAGGGISDVLVWEQSMHASKFFLLN